MLTEIYIEALLVDEELVDQVWAAWDKGVNDDQQVRLAWRLIVFNPLLPQFRTLNCWDSPGARWRPNAEKLPIWISALLRFPLPDIP